MKKTLLLTSLIAAGPAGALAIDWDRDPVPAALQELGPALVAPANAPERAPASQARTLDHFKGVLVVGGKKTEFCFSLSPEKVDQFEGDPDMSQGVFVTQAIPHMREGGKGCGTALQHNGGYIRSCSGLFLLDAPGLKGGPVFETLQRFDPHSGRLVVQPVGRWEVSLAEGCGMAAGSMEKADLERLAGLLAAEANEKAGQEEVGRLLSHACWKTETADHRCEFKYDLGYDIHWFGTEVITADLDADPPHAVLETSRRWSRD